jgi:hypothetical protein
MVTYNYSEQRRHDPELRGNVEKLLLAQNATLLEAAQTLQELVDKMRVLSIERNPIYDRCVAAVRSARYSVSSDADFMNRSKPNDTYIGNMAASEMGEYIHSIDFEARFGGLV